MRTVKMTIPGSTSNFGSGFDTLGMAINLYQRMEMIQNKSGRIQIYSLEDGTRINGKVVSIVEEASKCAFAVFRSSSFGFDLKLGGDLPVGKGLGASGALRLGVVAGLGYLTGVLPKPEEVLNLAAHIEHHPDNVSPALYGGFTVSSIVGKEVKCVSVPVEKHLGFVTALPEFEMDTEEARKLIPTHFVKQDVVHSINRAAMIAAAFTTRRYDNLKGLFDDRFHQPYRSKLLPQLSGVIDAAVSAGAIGGWLSGAGSGIMCLSMGNHKAIAEAMEAAIPGAKILILEADNIGIQIDSTQA